MFKKFSVGQRLGLAFGGVAFLIALVTAYAAALVVDLEGQLHTFSARRMANAVAAGKLIASLLETASHTRAVLIFSDRTQVAADLELARKATLERGELLAFLDGRDQRDHREDPGLDRPGVRHHDRLGRARQHRRGLSHEAGRAIAALADRSAEVREAVSEISGALREQSQAANDIARHVEGIAQMTQENSAAVDQTKESARALKQLASLLQGSVAQFKV